MKITIITVGSRGDVWPYMALGLGLQKSGHQVTLATHATFKGEIETLGMGFSPVEGDIRQLVGTESLRQVADTGNNPILFSWLMFSTSEHGLTLR